MFILCILISDTSELPIAQNLIIPLERNEKISGRKTPRLSFSNFLSEIISFPFSVFGADESANAVEEVVIEHRGPVRAVMIGGEWVEGIE